jgi:hypothetical protein
VHAAVRVAGAAAHARHSTTAPAVADAYVFSKMSASELMSEYHTLDILVPHFRYSGT